MIEILTAIPESMGIEEHLLRIMQTIERFRPAHIVVDAISATKRMGSNAAPFDFLVRLLSACRERGITCFYVNQAVRRSGVQDISGIGISSFIDTVVVIDYAWESVALVRSLFILKSRGVRHSLLRHRLSITDSGIAVDRPAADGGRGGNLP
jgi:circadian clock protein KaiC